MNIQDVCLRIEIFVILPNRNSRTFPQDGDSGTELDDDDEVQRERAHLARREEADRIQLHDPVMQVCILLLFANMKYRAYVYCCYRPTNLLVVRLGSDLGTIPFSLGFLGLTVCVFHTAPPDHMYAYRRACGHPSCHMDCMCEGIGHSTL